MKTVDIVEASRSLRTLVQDGGENPVVITDHGTPVAVLLPVRDADLETISLSLNPQFRRIIERSRASGEYEGTLSSAEVHRVLETVADEAEV